MKNSKEILLQALEDYEKMKRTMLLTPMEAAQVRMGPGAGVTGPRKILAKLLRKLRK